MLSVVQFSFRNSHSALLCRPVVLTEFGTQGISYFTHRGICPYRVENRRHQVIGTLGGPAQSGERGLKPGLVAPGAEPGEFLAAAPAQFRVNFQYIESGSSFFLKAMKAFNPYRVWVTLTSQVTLKTGIRKD